MKALLTALLFPLSALAAPPAGYHLVFSDEFNGNAVDRNKWQVTYDGNPDRSYTTYTNAVFWPSTNAKVTAGTLNLIVSKVGDTYRTAALTTKARWTYGYWEARVLAPFGNVNGIGANFWTNALGWNFPENDIWEWSGSDANNYRANWHNGTLWAATSTIHTEDGWTVVGMEWTPTDITWYLNGVERVSVVTNGAVPQPQWTLLGATVGPFGHRVDAETSFPATYKVDYLRIYQR